MRSIFLSAAMALARGLANSLPAVPIPGEGVGEGEGGVGVGGGGVGGIGGGDVAWGVGAGCSAGCMKVKSCASQVIMCTESCDHVY